MAALIKQIELLLLPEDEEEVMDEIRRTFPAVRVVDNRAWRSQDEAPVCDDLATCSDVAAIWNPEIYPRLSTSVRSNGVIDGPQVGEVIQWIRSASKGGVLDAGRWASSNDTERDREMVAFVKTCWKILMAKTQSGLIQGGPLDGPVRAGRVDKDFRAGRRALEEARSGRLTLASVGMRLLPPMG